LYDALLAFEGLSPVIDIGCGNGRNAIYLASKGCLIEAVDASSVALDELRVRASEIGVLDRISTRNTVLEAHWPYPSDRFGLALDAYVSCHLIDDRARDLFRTQARRVLRTGGLLFSAAFALEDEYYARLLSPHSEGYIVTDPLNGIAKRLYSDAEFYDFFSSEFRVVYQTKFQFTDLVLGDAYRRSVLTILAEK
jgi:SAM-dependent methyltransferase